MDRTSRSSLIALAFLGACLGAGTDTITHSNCHWSASTDFAGAGYRLFHQVPSYCPQEVLVQSPWQYSWEPYSAIVTGPLDGSTVLATSYFNDSWQNVHDHQAVFEQVGDEARATVYDSYPAATVSVVFGQERTDRAVSFPDGMTGSATVDLTYRGTAIIAMAPGTVLEGEVFTLQVYPESNQLIEPIWYQWFKDEQPLGDPTTSNTASAQIYGSGITVVFRVQATDAIGQVSDAKRRVYVTANCQNPPCPEQ